MINMSTMMFIMITMHKHNEYQDYHDDYYNYHDDYNDYHDYRELQ